MIGVASRRLACALALVIVSLAPAAVAAPLHALNPVTVSPPLASLAPCQLNGDDNTPRIVADPRDGRNLVATYLTGDARAAVAATSHDGGLTWLRRPLPGLTGCTAGPPGQLVDPSLAARPDGSFVASFGWVASSPPPGARNHDAVREYISHSEDGRAWSQPVDIEPSQPDQRGYFASAGGALLLETERSPYLAPVGYTLAEPAEVVVLRSADGGSTWGAAVPAATPAPGHAAVAGGLLAGPGGTVGAIWVDVDLATAVGPLLSGVPLQATIHAARSTDGGQTFADDIRIASCGDCTLVDSTLAPNGALIVAYSDHHPDGSSTLQVASSRDRGESWTLSRIASAPRDIPVVAVAARRGQLGVLATQSVQGVGDPVTATLWTSRNRGRSWSRLNLGGPYQRSTITHDHFDLPLGPEQGLVASQRGFGAVFTTLGPAKLVDGEQDVVYVGVTDRPVHHR